MTSNPNKLVLRTPFPDVSELWIDPITGLKVPKQVDANLRWRTALLRRAAKDDGFKAEMYTASSKSLLFWVNTFGWTYRVFMSMPDGSRVQCPSNKAHVPFVTWAIQDKHLLEIEGAIDGGRDLLTDKSRDMGATWDHIMPIYHKWLFNADQNFLLLSRKEESVDSSGKKGLGSPADPGTLFGKIDYVSEWMPDWMMPVHTRTKLHLVNLSNKSRIDGESANANAGSSDRRTAILLDEMAKMAEGEAIKRSTRDVTACRLANSTPNGAGTAFSNWRQSGKVKVFVLPWWEHPEKGVGRYIATNEQAKTDKIRSPWYDLESTVRTPKEMAIDVDMDHIGSGDTFFELSVLAGHKAQFASKPPVIAGMHITFDREVSLAQIPNIITRNQVKEVQSRLAINGPWTFFEHLIDGRPDQTRDYVFGIDISKGMGASNSVVSVGCVQTRMKVAEFANANFAPYDFAIHVAAAAIWFGGSQRGHRPFIIWESNGDPGIDFGKMLVKKLQYPSFYRDRHVVNKVGVKRAVKYGWHSDPDKKADLLSDYRRALAHGTFVNPSAQALVEAETYVYFAGGQIGPACLMMENASAIKTHGDRVIADALACKGIQEIGGHIRTNRPMEPPENSFGKRYQATMKRRKEARSERMWDTRLSRGLTG